MVAYLWSLCFNLQEAHLIKHKCYFVLYLYCLFCHSFDTRINSIKSLYSHLLNSILNVPLLWVLSLFGIPNSIKLNWHVFIFNSIHIWVFEYGVFVNMQHSNIYNKPIRCTLFSIIEYIGISRKVMYRFKLVSSNFLSLTLSLFISLYFTK